MNSELNHAERLQLLALLSKLKSTLVNGCTSSEQEDKDALEACLSTIDNVTDLVTDLQI